MNTKYNFANALLKQIGRILGNGYEVELKHIPRNNGISLEGIIIKKRNSSLASTIYIDEFYKYYLDNNSSIEELANKVLLNYQDSSIDVSKELSSILSSKDELLSKVCYRLVNRDKNQEYLCNAPHIDVVGDLTKIFVVVLDASPDGQWTSKITHPIIDSLDINIEELSEAAERNTKEKYKSSFATMNDVLTNLLGGDDKTLQLIPSDVGMYVLSNVEKVHGATCILYDGLLEKIASILNDNLYILPCSCHEVIILRASIIPSVNELYRMVHDVNSTEVSEEDFLSDNVFFFSKDSQALVVA